MRNEPPSRVEHRARAANGSGLDENCGRDRFAARMAMRVTEETAMSSMRLVHSVVVAALVVWGSGFSKTLADPQKAAADGKPERGLLYPIAEPITHESVEALRTAVDDYLRRATKENVEPVLVFQFGGGTSKTGSSAFYPCSELAELLSNAFRSAQSTIAYVPESLSGYALLPVLACDEVVLGKGASLGPITPEGSPVNALAPKMVETIAQAKLRDLALLRGMLDPSADLRQVRTSDGRVAFVLAADLPEYERQHEVTSTNPAWDEGQRGVLPADRARGLDLAKLLVRNRDEIERYYGIELEAIDPSKAGPPTALEIVVTGPIDSTKAAHIKRQISQVVRDKLDGSRESGVSLVILRIDSEGGEPEHVKEAADAIAGLGESGIHTVAFVENQAIGFATMLALACDEIVMKQGAKIGNVSLIVSNQNGQSQVDPKLIPIYTQEARDLARRKFHPELLAAGMVDPELEMVAALDTQSNALVYLAPEEVAAAKPGRYVVRPDMKVKQSGKPLVMTAQIAAQTGLASETVTDFKDWLDSRNVKKLRTAQPTWVDSLVETLNTQWMSGMLLFIGLFMLILELKLPGVGLPAILSALAFLLFFWSHYLGRTADTLEIVLFLAGMVCIGLELFVLPGFAVFGVSGILMVLASVVMACHTFIWPTTEYEFREMGWTVSKLAMTIVAVTVGVAILSKFLPSFPLFRRMILSPQSADTPGGLAGKPVDLDTSGPLTYLLGERGRTTTVCRPSGKARFGEQLIDITADGFFIEAGTPVEVVEVRGSLVIVKKV
jgi:membrane-bound serine protease (ClpP class)